MKRILIKIGTKILTTKENKLDLNNLRKLSNEISKLKITHKYQCIVVSSGSIISGSEALSVFPNSIPEKQASASIGQLLLLKEYSQFFGYNNIKIGQILLTKDFISNQTKQENVKNTILKLLDFNTIPIINENDSVATDEIQFGDNDILASIVAKFMNVDTFLILSDIDGVYDKNPLTNHDAKLIPQINNISQHDIDSALTQQDSKGKGGLKSKLMAAKYCMDNSIETIIANGRSNSSLYEIISSKKNCTVFKN